MIRWKHRAMRAAIVLGALCLARDRERCGSTVGQLRSSVGGRPPARSSRAGRHLPAQAFRLRDGHDHRGPSDGGLGVLRRLRVGTVGGYARRHRGPLRAGPPRRAQAGSGRRRTGSVSSHLHSSFVISAQMLFGWEWSVLIGAAAIGVALPVRAHPTAETALQQRRVCAWRPSWPPPPTTSSAGLDHPPSATPGFTPSSSQPAQIFVLVNITLVTVQISLASSTPFHFAFGDHLRHSGPAFH